MVKTLPHETLAEIKLEIRSPANHYVAEGWIIPTDDHICKRPLRNSRHSPSTGYTPEFAAVRLASRASSFIAGGRKQPLFSRSGEPPGNVASPSAINIGGAWLLPYGTPDIIGNGRHCADVSTRASSFPAVEPPPLLALLHSGRRTAPTAATGRPDPAVRPVEIHPACTASALSSHTTGCSP